MATAPAETPQQKAAREARELLHAQLRKVMSTADGQAVVWWVMHDLGYMLSQSDAGEHTHVSARNAGRRDVALDLHRELLAACGTDYRHMWRDRLLTSPPETSK